MMWCLLICVFLVGCCCAEKIIIIGAGAAGIATASRLLEHNITDFRILEAEDRIGGRIHSLLLGNAFVDIGAQFVHGQKGNAVYELSKKYLQHGRDIRKALLYYGEDKRSENTLIDEYISMAEDSKIAAENVSLGEAFLAGYNATILKKYESDQKMLIYSKDCLRTIECIVLTADGAFSWFRIASKSNFKFIKGDELMTWDGLGFRTVLDLLLKNYPDKTGFNIENQISLEKTVTRIIPKNNAVKIRCKDGSEFVSEHVVFTASLGVLKHDHKNLFMPRLEKIKVDAIEDLGMDGVVKVVFEFPSAWWGNQEDFVFVWTEEKKKKLVQDVPFGPMKNGDHWLSWFYHVGRSTKISNILIGWILGPMVPDIEKLTEEQMKIGTLYAMRTFLGKDFNITEPSKVIHSKWYTNPNFRGVYSFETINSMRHNNPSAHDILAEPISDRDGVPRVLFAGEATNSKNPASVDGAIETGYREADRLIKILKMK